MHRLSTSFVLGYHGCDLNVARRLLSGEPFQRSENEYDWLGPGIYFWEANPKRAYSFAAEVSRRFPERIAEAAVVGGVIELGLCLDLATEAGILQVQEAYRLFRTLADAAKIPLVVNQGGDDRLLRKLDCAVIRHVHEIRQQRNQPPIDTVRGIFTEGRPAYPGAGFFEKTHSQVCVCNPLQIKGVFRVSESELA